ncbi:hypothetical protein LO80_05630 [Candidatus Francisella endociliophora]|uniref:Gluconokinase n=2 Tax=Candidatus Francisella endociliophora TaxID=653937 RepID=A0A097ERU5_9GAMM|nr:hypothetical protein LO80_05630 [Francisella sp. FSC1006]
MGVSGCGKSTVGKALSKKLNIPFIDGDILHPESNIKKMKSGTPLTDDDRKDWLKNIGEILASKHIIIACSALKKKYRDQLRSYNNKLHFLHLHGSFSTIENRMTKRSDHYMPISLLESQFSTLEFPKNEKFIVNINIEKSVEEIINEFIEIINK